MTTHFRAALALAAAGLVVLVVALPLPLLAISDPVLGADADAPGFTGDDVVMAVVIAVIATVVLVAGVLRRPVVLSWALVPVALFTGWVVLVAADVGFDTTFLASEVTARVNGSRSLAAGSWLTGVGLLLVVVGLAVPLLERWRVRAVR